MLQNAENLLNNVYARSLQPQKHDLTISQWADHNRVLSSKSSAEPGRWSTDRTPYLKEPMDALSVKSDVSKVVMMFGAQLGKTEAGLNFIGYSIDYSPSSFLMVQPTVDISKRVSKQRLDPMISECSTLREKIPPARSRDSGNTVLQKEYPGGLIMLAGANSAAGLRSMPVRDLFLDEVDAYPGDVEGEGDPVALAEARTRTYRNRKILMTSTPTIRGRSRIEAEFLRTDQRYFHVPCPECEEKQVLKLSNLRWDKGKHDTAHYVCEHCGSCVDEKNKTWMLANGEWIASHPENKDRGYQLSSLYSPVGFFSWAEIAEKFDQAKKKVDELRVFTNTILAETWEEKGEAPEWEELYRKREDYKIGAVPEGVLVLTASVDVQKDRLECEVKGWGRNLWNWSIDKLVLRGDTTEQDVWNQLENVLNKRYEHANGSSLIIRLMAVDSGYNTQTVYNWVRQQPQDRVMAIKGQENLMTMIGSPKQVDNDLNGKIHYRAVRFYPVGISLIKQEYFEFLRKKPPLNINDPYPYGYCHYPQYDQETFKQIASESKIKRIVNGRTRFLWQKHYERNEMLDLHVYNRACAAILGVDRYTDDDWNILEQNLINEAELNRRYSPKNENQSNNDWINTEGEWL